MIKQLVAIIGGSFDPPTIAHAMMAAELINKQIVQKVIFIPCGKRNDKNLQEGYHRLEMLKLSINDLFPESVSMKINDIELQRGQMVPTYYLLQELTRLYPTDKLYFVIGGDLVKDLSKWEQGNKLVEEMNFIIMERQNYKYDRQQLPKNHIIVEEFHFGISATEVRERIMKSQNKISNMNILGLVSKSVLEYIQKNNLYLK